MLGFRFSDFQPAEDGASQFEKLLDLFMQILTKVSGDVAEALHWLNLLDNK